MRKKGVSPNPAGRPKGIKDKRHLYLDVKQLLIEKGADPAAVLVELMTNSKDESIRIKAATELSKKYLPDRKAVEHRTDDKQHDDLIELKKRMIALQLEVKKDY